MTKHQKAISAPKTYPIERKGGGWTIQPSPGPHSKEECVPLGIVIRDVLGYADSIKEVKKILQEGKCKVDQRVVKDYRFPLGIFDSLSLQEEKFYRLVPSRKGFKLVEIGEEEASKKLCRVEGKKRAKKGRTQVQLNDGKNLLMEETGLETGDSVLLNIPELEIIQTVRRKEGNKLIITRGKNRGQVAEFREIKVVRGSGSNRAVAESSGAELDLPEKLVFMVGEEEPVIQIGD